MSSPTWALRTPLTDWLEQEARATPEGSRLLDVGCGRKPYYPVFADSVSAYVGVDMVENPVAELLGPIEALPVEDGSFDVVLCTQVLEHSDDPAQAVKELRRVTAPGGRVLASTHGTWVYHPSPQDYWRWTHTGLERLFHQNGEWASVEVRAAQGTAATLTMILATYLDIALRRTPLSRPPVWALNRLGAALDGRVASLRDPIPGSLIANFHVVATVGP
jgi:SAM-dependent methyltransferase